MWMRVFLSMQDASVIEKFDIDLKSMSARSSRRSVICPAAAAAAANINLSPILVWIHYALARLLPGCKQLGMAASQPERKRCLIEARNKSSVICPIRVNICPPPCDSVCICVRVSFASSAHT